MKQFLSSKFNELTADKRDFYREGYEYRRPVYRCRKCNKFWSFKNSQLIDRCRYCPRCGDWK